MRNLHRYSGFGAVFQVFEIRDLQAAGVFAEALLSSCGYVKR